jgi:hypothetical protein
MSTTSSDQQLDLLDALDQRARILADTLATPSAPRRGDRAAADRFHRLCAKERERLRTTLNRR